MDTKAAMDSGDGQTVKQEVSRGEGVVPEVEVSGEAKQILLAEDEREIRQVAEKILKRRGYEVIAVANGLEALERYQEKPDEIDLIILDLNMPKMDGEQCLRELKKLGCRAPVIIATGAGLRPDCETDLLQDAFGIVMKPFGIHSLIRAVSEALQEAPSAASGP